MAIEKIAITDREQWLAMRKHDVTASAVAALFGASEYDELTPRRLYELKTGAIEEDGDDPVIDGDAIKISPMMLGLLMEEPAKHLLHLLRPSWAIEKCRYYYRDPDLRIGATPDLLVDDPGRGPGIVQIKNPNHTYKTWHHDDGAIEPPVGYAIQTILEAHLTGARWAAVAAIVSSGRNDELRLLPIQIHSGIIEGIKVRVAEFWDRVATKRPYDFDYALDGALIAKLYSKGKDEVEIDLSSDNKITAAVDLLETSRRIKKDAERDERTAKAFITAKMGEASFARIADGRRISHKTQHRAAYEVAESEFRVMRVLKGR